MVAVLIVAALIIDALDGSDRRFRSFARPGTATPRATELALQPGNTMTVVTGSRSRFTADGAGRLVVSPVSRNNSWQIGVADLRTDELAWTGSVVPGVRANRSSDGAATVSGPYLLEPGRMVQGPESAGWSLLELGTGEQLVEATDPSLSSGCRTYRVTGGAASSSGRPRCGSKRASASVPAASSD